MKRRFFIFILVIGAIGLGGGVVYGFWLTLGALVFLLYLAAAWPWTLYAFYFLVAYLPFQAALNLTPEIDLMSGRVLILGLFGVWVVKEIMRRMRYTAKNKFLPSSGCSLYEGENKILDSRFRGNDKYNHVFFAIILFFLLSAISILGAANLIWGLRKLLVFASIFPLFWLAAVLIKNKEDARRIIYIIIGSAAISALIALAQFLAQFIFGLEAVMNFWALRVVPIFSGASFGGLVVSNPSWLVNVGGQTVMRAIGLFPDPHMLSFYLGLTLPFSLALLIFNNFSVGIKNTTSPPAAATAMAGAQSSPQPRRGGKAHRLILFVACCLLFIVLLLTFSRGGYIGLIAGITVFVVVAWRRLKIKDKKFLSIYFLLAVAILLFIGWPVAARLISSFDVQEGSNMGRLAIWQDSWQSIKKSPIIGTGLGNYSLTVNFKESYRSAVTSHNVYLDLWAETGIFGLLAWIILLLSAAGAAYKKMGQYPVLALGVLSGLTYFFAHSFFETAIFNPTILAVLMVVLALANKMGTNYK